MSDANRTKLSYAKNSVALGGTFGIMKTSPAFKQVLVTSDALKGGIKYVESQTILPSARVKSLRRVGYKVGGTIGLEFFFGNADDFLEGLFFSTWQRTPQRYNATAATQIVGLVSGTGVITHSAAVAGDENQIGTFGVGHLIRAEGETTNPGNNFLKRATAASGTTVTVSTAGLVTNAALNAGYKLKAVGIEAPAVGNIQTTTAGLAAGSSGAITGTGVDFVALGMVAGMWFKLALSATAANNGWYRVLSLTSTRIECDIVPAGFATDTAAALQLRLYLPDYLRDGQNTVIWYDMERQLQDLTTPEYDTFISMLPANFSVDLSPDGLDGCSMDFVGGAFNNSTSRTAGFSDITADPLGAIPRAGDPFDTATGVAQIREGSAALAAIVTQLSFGIANGAGTGPVVAQLADGKLTRARFRPTATLKSYYLSNALRTKLINDTLTGISSILLDPIGTKAYVIDYPSGKFTAGDIEGIVPDGQRQLPLTFQAIENVAYGCAAQVMRFYEWA